MMDKEQRMRPERRKELCRSVHWGTSLEDHNIEDREGEGDSNYVHNRRNEKTRKPREEKIS